MSGGNGKDRGHNRDAGPKNGFQLLAEFVGFGSSLSSLRLSTTDQFILPFSHHLNFARGSKKALILGCFGFGGFVHLALGGNLGLGDIPAFPGMVGTRSGRRMDDFAPEASQDTNVVFDSTHRRGSSSSNT